MFRTALRPLLAVLALVLSAGLLAACGGDEEAASASQDPRTVLAQTFGGKAKKARSGNLQLGVKLDMRQAGRKQAFALRLTGPFVNDDPKLLPRFDLALDVDAQGQSFTAGAVSTGTKGYLKVQGRAFAVGDDLFRQFRTGYERAQRQAPDPQGGAASLRSLGVDPRRWLKHPRDAGTEEVGGAETVHVTSGVDVPRFLDDVNRLLANAGKLGVQGTQGLPQGLTDAQRREATEAVKGAKVDIWSGREDKILRRIRVVLDVDSKSASTPVTGRFELDYLVSKLNEEQKIEEPSGARPLSELTGALGALGLGGGSSSGGSGSGGSGGSGGGSSSGDDGSGAYLDCLEKAGSDAAKIQDCAAELSTP